MDMPRRSSSTKTPARRHAVSGERLGPRALNRALLARQLLLERCTRPALDVIDHLVGMQAQIPRDPYVALWSRLERFDPDELARLIMERRVARSPLMRGTRHLATARDCLALRPLLQRVFTRTQKGAFGRQLAGADLAALAEAGRTLLETQPRSFAELRALLGDEWAAYDPAAVGYSISYLVPLVQVPPRGLWNETGPAVWMTTDAWFGRPLNNGISLEDVVMRYLAAFGPASVNDIQSWCGLTRLREVVEPLRPRLRTFRDETGRELFDLVHAPRPDPDTPAPPRFLPAYDNVFLAHVDRARIVPETYRQRATPAADTMTALFIDGFLAATWQIVKQRKRATLHIGPLARLSRKDRDAVAEEGKRLLAFAASDAERHDIRFDRAG